MTAGRVSCARLPEFSVRLAPLVRHTLPLFCMLLCHTLPLLALHHHGQAKRVVKVARPGDDGRGGGRELLHHPNGACPHGLSNGAQKSGALLDSVCGSHEIASTHRALMRERRRINVCDGRRPNVDDHHVRGALLRLVSNQRILEYGALPPV